MNLLDENYENFHFIERRHVPDGQGGFNPAYSIGETFQGCAMMESSTEVEIASALGVKSLYTIATNSDIILESKEIVQRASDGKYFYITSESVATPKGAGLQLRKVRAREWEMPTNE